MELRKVRVPVLASSLRKRKQLARRTLLWVGLLVSVNVLSWMLSGDANQRYRGRLSVWHVYTQCAHMRFFFRTVVIY